MSHDDISEIDGPSPDPDWVPTVRDVREAVWSIQEQGERLRWYLDRPGGEPREEDHLVHEIQAFLMGPLGQYADYLAIFDESGGSEERAYADLAGRTYDDYLKAMEREIHDHETRPRDNDYPSWQVVQLNSWPPDHLPHLAGNAEQWLDGLRELEARGLVEIVDYHDGRIAHRMSEEGERWVSDAEFPE